MNKAEKATASSPSIVTKAEKAASNGHSHNHIRQLKTEQQLTLSRIQKKIFQYQAQAGQYTEEARKLVDQARAADLEFAKILQGYAKTLGVDLNADADFDFEKLQFKPKERTN